MHTLTRFAVAAVLSIVVVTAIGQPASAGQGQAGRGDGGVTPTEDGYLGRVRAQVNELNRYVSNPPPCHYRPGDATQYSAAGEGWTTGDGHLPEPLPEGARNGYWRYRLLREVGPDDPTVWAEGLQYVRECYAGGPVDTVEEDGWAPGWSGVIIFDAVTPENLARLAMEEFFLGLDAPDPEFSPAGPTLVNVETWMWVEGDIPAEEIASEVISVPGLAVQAFAQVREVRWDMGEGEDGTTCPLATDPASAQAVGCIYQYEASSAGQAGEVFHGSATLVWAGRYEIDGAPAPEVLPDILRETPFELGVAEAQAVNTNG